MYATTWLDQETFAAIADYCRRLPSFREPDEGEENEAVELTAQALPDLQNHLPAGGGLVAGSVSIKLTGSLSACAHLYDLGSSGKIEHTPRVRVHFTGLLSPSTPSDAAGVDVVYSYHCAHDDRKGRPIDAYTRLDVRPTSGTPGQRRDLVGALAERLKLPASFDGEGKLLVSGDRVALVSEPYREPYAFLEPVREGRVAVEFDPARVSLIIYRSQSVVDLQERALGLVEALGQEHITEVTASYTVSRSTYDAIREAAANLDGEWWVMFMTKGGYSVSDFVDAPERIPAEVNSLEVGFDVSLPVVGETHIGVDAERESGGSFRYRLRFYRDYEHGYDRPGVREVRPSETEEGRGLPFLRELEDEALEGVGSQDHVASAEDLAMHALLRQWGGGRDIIDHDYEE